MIEFKDAFEMMDSYMTPEQIAESDRLAEQEILKIRLQHEPLIHSKHDGHSRNGQSKIQRTTNFCRQ